MVSKRTIFSFCKFFAVYASLLVYGGFYAPALANTYPWQQGQALDTAKSLSQFTLDSWGIEDGLPSNAVLAQLKAKDGYFWLATYDGLARFDGRKFRVYNQKSNPEFHTNNLFGLLEDSNNHLWIATNGGVLKKSGETFSQIPSNEFLTNQSLTALAAGDAGQIWVGTRSGLSLIRNNTYVAFPEQERFKNLHIFTLFSDSKGSLWIGTVGDGLWEIQDGLIRKYNQSHGLNNNSVRTIFEDSKGRLWIGTEEGICQMVNGRIREVPILGGSFSSFVNHILEDAYGSFWFATSDGLLRYTKGTFELLKTDQEGGPNELQTVYSDGEGSLWIGSYYKGLMRLRDGKFNNYSSLEGLPNDVVNVVWPEGGDVWVGTNAGLAHIRQGAIAGVYQLDNTTAANRIRDIYRDSKGTMWVGTNDGLFHQQGEKFEKVLQKGAGLSSDKIRRIVEDKQGRIWIGTRNGLFVRNPASPKEVSVVNELSGVFILSLYVDGAGGLWVATNGKGLYHIRENKLKHYTIADGLSSNILFDTWEDRDGNVWVCSNDGLNVYRNGSWHQMNEKKGFFANTVFQVLPDKFDNLWITSNKGIYLLKRKELLAQLDTKQAKINTYKQFTTADGLRSSQITPLSISRSAANGQLWFATLSGLSAIHPAQLVTNQNTPKVVLEKISGDKLIYPYSSEIRFAAGTRHYEFQYTAFNYYAPKATTFSYMLEGFDHEWQQVGDRRVAYYTNLPAGNYTFRVKAANEDGIWSQEEAVVSVVQEAYFYETLFFKLLLGVFLLSFLVLFYLWRTRLLHNKASRLEQMVDERTNHIIIQKEAIEQQKEELTKLNQLKDKLLSVLSHDLRQPFSSIAGLLALLRDRQIDQQEFQHFSQELNQQVKWQVHMLDNILMWIRNQVKGLDVKPVLLNLHQLSEELVLLHRSQANFKQISLLNNVEPGTTVIADADILHLVLRNLLGNAIKFTPQGGQININACTEKEVFRIEVTDTGIGIPEAQLAQLFDSPYGPVGRGTSNEKGAGLGLVLCREFLEACDGKIRAESSPGCGSRFIIELPKHKAYQPMRPERMERKAVLSRSGF